MPHLSNQALEVILYCAAGAGLLYLGFRIGVWFGMLRSSKSIAQKEQELFAAQKGFKNIYDSELAVLRTENAKLKERIKTLTKKVEQYRRKAAGLGGLFNSGGKRADAMYALLLENEALEEALHNQNQKLAQERTDALNEQMRATNYRRVLISQLLSDDRIKGYISEVLGDDKRLPSLGETPADPKPQDHDGK